MQSLLNEHALTSMLLVQVIGFPIAFLIRALIHAWRWRRGPELDRRLNGLQSASNVCFALACGLFYILHFWGKILAVACFVAGVILIVKAFQVRLRRKQMASLALTSSVPISIRSSKLSKRQRVPH